MKNRSLIFVATLLFFHSITTSAQVASPEAAFDSPSAEYMISNLSELVSTDTSCGSSTPSGFEVWDCKELKSNAYIIEWSALGGKLTYKTVSFLSGVYSKKAWLAREIEVTLKASSAADADILIQRKVTCPVASDINVDKDIKGIKTVETSEGRVTLLTEYTDINGKQFGVIAKGPQRLQPPYRVENGKLVLGLCPVVDEISYQPSDLGISPLESRDVVGTYSTYDLSFTAVESESFVNRVKRGLKVLARFHMAKPIVDPILESEALEKPYSSIGNFQDSLLSYLDHRTLSNIVTLGQVAKRGSFRANTSCRNEPMYGPRGEGEIQFVGGVSDSTNNTMVFYATNEGIRSCSRSTFRPPPTTSAFNREVCNQGVANYCQGGL